MEYDWWLWPMLTRKNTVNGRSFLFVWAWSFHNFSFMDTEIPPKRHFNVKFQWNEEFLSSQV